MSGRLGAPLTRSFYERPPAAVARELLGCLLVSRIGGRLTAGRIVETEAYLGPEDGASHAAFRPGSHPLFYGPGGIAYVFRVYGLHFCLNAIAGPPGTPGCVLLRAVEPLLGLDAMAARRGRQGAGRHPGAGSADPEPAGRQRKPRVYATLASGPARLTQALGVTLAENGADLRRGVLTVRRDDATGRRPWPTDVAVGTRVGITRSRALPLRFALRWSPSVSRPWPW